MDKVRGFEPRDRGPIPLEGTYKNLDHRVEIFNGDAITSVNFLKAMVFE